MLMGKEVPGGEIFIAEPTKPRVFPDIQGISLVPRSLQVSVNSYVPGKKFKGYLVLHPHFVVPSGTHEGDTDLQRLIV